MGSVPIIKFTQASLDSSLPTGVALPKMEGLAQEVTQNISQMSYGARLQARHAGHLRFLNVRSLFDKTEYILI